VTIEWRDVMLGDAGLRAALAERYPALWARLRARQDFIRQQLGLDMADEVLPRSVAPAYFPPLWLRPGRVLAAA
jgi:hypothetical protein